MVSIGEWDIPIQHMNMITPKCVSTPNADDKNTLQISWYQEPELKDSTTATCVAQLKSSCSKIFCHMAFTRHQQLSF